MTTTETTNTKKNTAAPKARTGPPKEKGQITIRIDLELMKSVSAQLKEDGARITDAVERGLILWLNESRHQLPAWTKQIRHVLADANKRETVLIRGLAIMMKENEVKPLNPDAQKIYDLCVAFLEERNTLEHAEECLKRYSRKRGN
jgi:uncharacterized protein (DUF4415 family)